MAQDLSNSWHLDKKVPIVLIITLLIQGAGLVSWGTSLNHRVAATEASIARLDGQAELRRVEAQQQAVQLGRIEEQITGMRDDVARLIAVIERSER